MWKRLNGTKTIVRTEKQNTLHCTQVFNINTQFNNNKKRWEKKDNSNNNHSNNKNINISMLIPTKAQYEWHIHLSIHLNICLSVYLSPYVCLSLHTDNFLGKLTFNINTLCLTPNIRCYFCDRMALYIH